MNHLQYVIYLSKILLIGAFTEVKLQTNEHSVFRCTCGVAKEKCVVPFSCLFICVHVLIPIGQIALKFGIGDSHENLLRKSKFG